MGADTQDIELPARSFLAFWQPRMVPEWTVTLRLAVLSEDQGYTSVTSYARTRQACITIDPQQFASPALYDHGQTTDERMEYGMVHELCHLIGARSSNQIAGEVRWLVGEEGLVGAGIRSSLIEYEEDWVSVVAGILIALRKAGGL